MADLMNAYIYTRETMAHNARAAGRGRGAIRQEKEISNGFKMRAHALARSHPQVPQRRGGRRATAAAARAHVWEREAPARVSG